MKITVAITGLVLASLPISAMAQDVVMRRPLPINTISNPNSDPGDPQIDNTTFVAYASCNGGTNNVTCLQVLTDGNVNETNVSNCIAQNPDSADYAVLSSNYAFPSGSFAVSPSSIEAVEGTSCTQDAVKTRTTIGGYCGYDDGRPPLCEQFTYTYTGSGSGAEIISVIGSDLLNHNACKKTATLTPEDELALNYWGDFAPSLDFDTKCPAASEEDPGGPADSFYVDNPQCTTEVVTNPDGSTTINNVKNLNCVAIFNFTSDGGGGFGYSSQTVPDSYCEYKTSNTPAERDIIRDFFSSEYQDPDTVSGGCPQDAAVLGDRRADTGSAMYSFASSVVPFPDGYWYSYWKTISYYPVMCHRYRGNIFPAIESNPYIMDISGMVPNQDDLECSDLIAAEMAQFEGPDQCEQIRAEFAANGWDNQFDLFPACDHSVTLGNGYIRKVESEIRLYTNNPPSEGQVYVNNPPISSLTHTVDVPRN